MKALIRSAQAGFSTFTGLTPPCLHSTWCRWATLMCSCVPHVPTFWTSETLNLFIFFRFFIFGMPNQDPTVVSFSTSVAGDAAIVQGSYDIAWKRSPWLGEAANVFVRARKLHPLHPPRPPPIEPSGALSTGRPHFSPRILSERVFTRRTPPVGNEPCIFPVLFV